nr:hypothetical protein [Lautropia sp.]
GLVLLSRQAFIDALQVVCLLAACIMVLTAVAFRAVTASRSGANGH